MPVSPLRDVEIAMKAEFTEAAGWTVPARYEDPAAEHAFARVSVAVVDRSPIGRIKVTGKDRLDLLHRLCTQHLKEIVLPGRGAPAVFTTNKGRIVDLAGVYDLGDSLLLLTSPQRREILPNWIRKYVVIEQIALTDVTFEGAAFRLIGPLAPQLVEILGDLPSSALEPGRIIGVPIAGIEATVIGQTAGERPSILVIAELPGAVELFRAAVQTARALGGGPMGEEARNVLRVEDGRPEADTELSEDYNPWEARLDAAISLTKGCYIGQEVIARLNTYDKVSKRLVGLRMGAAPPPQSGSKITVDDHDVGVVTSAVRSAAAGETIGLGYLRIAHGEPGTTVKIEIGQGGEGFTAKVTSLPIVP